MSREWARYYHNNSLFFFQKKKPISYLQNQQCFFAFADLDNELFNHGVVGTIHCPRFYHLKGTGLKDKKEICRVRYGGYKHTKAKIIESFNVKKVNMS